MNPRERYESHVAARRARLGVLCGELLKGQPRVTLEIGSGHGHFFAAYAQAHPESFCLGVDISSLRVRKACGKAARGGLTNLHFLKAEAGELLLEMPVSVRLERVFVLFPDPWPKKRHIKNRLFSPHFLSLLAARCLPQAELYLRTDHEPYFQWALDQIAGHPCWEIDEESHWPFEASSFFQELAPSYFSLIGRVVAGEAGPGYLGESSPSLCQSDQESVTVSAP